VRRFASKTITDSENVFGGLKTGGELPVYKTLGDGGRALCHGFLYDSLLELWPTAGRRIRFAGIVIRTDWVQPLRGKSPGDCGKPSLARTTLVPPRTACVRSARAGRQGSRPLQRAIWAQPEVNRYLSRVSFFCGCIGFFKSRGGPEPHGGIGAAACHEGAIPRESGRYHRAKVPLQSKSHLARCHVP
jgi:hypothetical protein